MEIFLTVIATTLTILVIFLGFTYFLYRKIGLVPVDRFRIRIRNLLQRGFHYGYLCFKDPKKKFYFYIVKIITDDDDFNLELFLPMFSETEKLKKVELVASELGLSHRDYRLPKNKNKKFFCINLGNETVFADEIISRIITQCYGYSVSSKFLFSGGGISKEIDLVISQKQQPSSWIDKQKYPKLH